MAEEQKSIFTRKAADQLRSPDDLDEYVRVTNPSIWVVLAACTVLMLGLFAWGFFGTAETNVTAQGTCVDGEVLCFLTSEKVENVRAGNIATVNGTLMEVESISEVPLSRGEAREIVEGDYLANTLVEGEWAYVVRLRGPSDGGDEPSFPEGVPLSITITTERIAPISLIFKDVGHA